MVGKLAMSGAKHPFITTMPMHGADTTLRLSRIETYSRGPEKRIALAPVPAVESLNAPNALSKAAVRSRTIQLSSMSTRLPAGNAFTNATLEKLHRTKVTVTGLEELEGTAMRTWWRGRSQSRQRTGSLPAIVSFSNQLETDDDDPATADGHRDPTGAAIVRRLLVLLRLVSAMRMIAKIVVTDTTGHDEERPPRTSVLAGDDRPIGDEATALPPPRRDDRNEGHAM